MTSTENNASMWVPVCCGRVMRYNTLGVGAEAKGGLVCTACGKHIALEPEPVASLSTYGKGSKVMSVLGTPKPPKTERGRPARKTDSDTDVTL